MLKKPLLYSLAALFLFTGCGGETPTQQNTSQHGKPPPGDNSQTNGDNINGPGHREAGHSHVAPHGGLVNSVGNFHVELVFDEKAATLVIYILGEDGMIAQPTDAQSIPAQVKIEDDDGFTSLTFSPSPLNGEKTGAVSCFSTPAGDLAKVKMFDVFLRIPIAGKQYRTAFQVTPGRVPVAGKTYRCPMNCEKGKLYRQPGPCPVCQMAIVEFKEGELEHADHTPKHGGTFFMAPNNWHHIEGTLASPSEFRLYFYDNFTKPISPKGYEGTAEVVRLDTKGDEMGKAIKLSLILDASGEFLNAKIPSELVSPLYFTVRVTLEKGERPSLFNFTFDKITGAD